MCYETQGQGRSAWRAGHRTSNTKLLCHSQRKILLLVKLSKWWKCKTCLVQLASEHTPTLCCSFKEACRGGVSPNVLYEFWILRVYFFPRENLTWKVPRIYITISLVNNTQVIVWETQAVSGDCDASLTISIAWAPEFRFWGVLKIILTWSDGPVSPTLNSWL